MDRELKVHIDLLAKYINKVISRSSGQSLILALKNAGIAIKYFANEPYRAFLTWDPVNQCPIIAVNADSSQTNQNFAIAHELGHFNY